MNDEEIQRTAELMKENQALKEKVRQLMALVESMEKEAKDHAKS